MVPHVLTIAGSDPSGGAGLQADLRAMACCKVHGLSVVTALTAQNSTAVSAIHEPPISMIEAQLDLLVAEFEIAAVKTGMIASPEAVEAVAGRLQAAELRTLIVDPVMMATSGGRLMNRQTVEALVLRLIPQALLVTPNVPEAEILSGDEIRTVKDAEKAARRLCEMGCRAVLIKGGHLEASPATDILCDGERTFRVSGEWVENAAMRGTGCAYASMIAAYLARGSSLLQAIRSAKATLTMDFRTQPQARCGQREASHRAKSRAR